MEEKRRNRRTNHGSEPTEEISGAVHLPYHPDPPPRFPANLPLQGQSIGRESATAAGERPAAAAASDAVGQKDPTEGGA